MGSLQGYGALFFFMSELFGTFSGLNKSLPYFSFHEDVGNNLNYPHFFQMLNLICFRLFGLFLITLFVGFLEISAQVSFSRVSGLSQNTVYTIAADTFGFVWIGTGNGINRFDGHTIKTITPKSFSGGDGLHGRFVRNGFLNDATGNLWFSTETGTQFLERKSGKVRTCFVSMQGKRLKLQGTFPLAQEGENYWLVNESSGIYLYNPVKESASRFPLLKDKKGFDIPIQLKGSLDKSGNFWFASNSGFHSFQRKQLTWKQFLSDRKFTAVSCIGDTIVGASGDELVFYIPEKSFIKVVKAISPLSPAEITVLHTAADGKLWVGDSRGNVFVRNCGQWEAVWMGNINNGSQNETFFPVYSLYATPDGTLWVGADVLGLFRANMMGEYFRHYPAVSEGSNAWYVQSVLPLSDKKVLLGLYQYGIRELNLETQKTTQVLAPCDSGRKSQSGTLLFQDKSGNIWAFACGGLFVRDKAENRWQSIDLEIPPGLLTAKGSITVYKIAEYGSQKLLATSIGLYKIRLHNRKLIASHVSSLGYTSILDIWVHSARNEVWLALETGGVGIVNDLDKAPKKKLLPGQELNSIRAFCYDSADADKLWAATLSGLLCIDVLSQESYLYNENDGLLNSYLHAIEKVSNELWFSNNHGIVRAVIKNGKNTKSFPVLSFEQYGMSDGLPTEAFNGGASGKLSSGKLLFGSASGLIWFSPDRFRSSGKSFPVRLVALQINGRNFSDTLQPEFVKKMELKHNQHTLLFRFQGILYTDIGKLAYRYKLKGFDDDWNYSGNANEARYRGLSPGKYVFMASARHLQGSWTSPVCIDITIVPPYWKSPVFYIPCLILIISSTLLTIRYFSRRRLIEELKQFQKEREIEQERKRISREMHDDIGAGLTQIILMSEALVEHYSNEKAKRIAVISRSLVENITEIIWSLRQETVTLQELLAYLREQFSEMLEEKKCIYAINFCEPENNPVLDFKRKRNIYLILKEVMHNAIKHSNAEQISMYSRISPGRLRFVIEDNGIGFDPKNSIAGNGLRNIELRAAELNALFTVHSSMVTGSTVVQLDVPVAGLLPKSHS